MYRMFFIARNNLVKKKSDVITLIILIMLSTLLLYISISVLRLTPQVIDTVCDEVNTADVFFASPCPKTGEIKSVLNSMENIRQIEYSEGVELTAKYHKDGTEEKETVFLIEPIETVGEVCKIPDVGDGKKYQTILLPYYMKAGENIAEGDHLYLALGDTEYEFEVGGFVEDSLFSTPLNISVFRCYITEEYYKDILAAESKVREMITYIYKMKIDDKISSRDFAAEMSGRLSQEVLELADYMNLAINIETMKVGVSFLSNIGMGIMLAFSVILICIALIIAWCSIKNFIDGNLKNLGILMTSGYTKWQLMGSTCTEMLLLSVTGVCLGLIAGGLLNKTVGTLVSSLIGLRWNQPYDSSTAVSVFVLVNVVVLLVTMLSGRIYGRIEILEALRGGIKTHNFRGNPIPLVKFPLPQPLALGIKNILGEKRKNAAIMGVVALLGFASSIGFALMQNFGSDNQALIEMMGVELGTVLLSGSGIEEAGKQMETWDEVRKVLYYDNRSVKLTAGEEQIVITCDFWKDPEQNEYTVLVEGRRPKYDNEIVVTANVAEQLGVKAGDIIYVEGDQEKKDYMISGVSQQMENLGLKATMTMGGAARINGSSVVNQIRIYTEEDCAYEQIEKKIRAEFPDLDITDLHKNMEIVLSSVKAAMTILCAVFVTITVVIVMLTIILLVKTKTTREWKQYGVYKALGFTTGELIVQIQMSSLPVFLVGAILGAVMSVYLLNPLLEVCLGSAGIVQSSLTVHAGWLILSVAIIMAVSAGMSFLCAYRVRKVEPVKMLTEEG
ncbi:MAG: ABC transporter permease [Lachnospiraceae bacterium]|nr:ABC transporter permease [Lachnospiraceae bacterium]